MTKRNLIWLAAIVAAAMVTLILTRTPPQIISTVRVEFDPVTEAYRTIKEHYLYPVEGNLIRRRAIEGMVRELDEYSTYIPPARAEAFADRMAGQAWGLGLKVEVSGGQVVVIGALANSPAQNCGLLGGERIIKVDGHDLSKLSRAAVEDLLDDPAESLAVLTVLRADGRKETLRCRRGKFTVETVQGLSRGRAGEWVYPLPGHSGLAYLRVREVLPATPGHLRGRLPQLGRFRAILMDLRDNPGGDLPAAVELANIFLREGPIVGVVDRAGRTDHAAIPALRAVEEDVRLVILMNERTASAAEMIAAALAFRDRAVLVGQRTLGKGCIQSMIRLEGELGRLNLTTAEFFVDPLRPIQRCRDANVLGAEGVLGRSTMTAELRRDPNIWGVDPHVPVRVPAALEANLALWRARAEVATHSRPATAPATADAQEDDPGAVLLRLDPQLKRAVALASNPAEMDGILRRAAEARAAARRPAADTQTAPAATRTRPAAGSPAHE